MKLEIESELLVGQEFAKYGVHCDFCDKSAKFGEQVDIAYICNSGCGDI
jgi:hypothetical protein